MMIFIENSNVFFMEPTFCLQLFYECDYSAVEHKIATMTIAAADKISAMATWSKSYFLYSRMMIFIYFLVETVIFPIFLDGTNVLFQHQDLSDQQYFFFVFLIESLIFFMKAM